MAPSPKSDQNELHFWEVSAPFRKSFLKSRLLQLIAGFLKVFRSLGNQPGHPENFCACALHGFVPPSWCLIFGPARWMGGLGLGRVARASQEQSRSVPGAARTSQEQPGEPGAAQDPRKTDRPTFHEKVAWPSLGGSGATLGCCLACPGHPQGGPGAARATRISQGSPRPHATLTHLRFMKSVAGQGWLSLGRAGRLPGVPRASPERPRSSQSSQEQQGEPQAPRNTGAAAFH